MRHRHAKRVPRSATVAAAAAAADSKLPFTRQLVFINGNEMTVRERGGPANVDDPDRRMPDA